MIEISEPSRLSALKQESADVALFARTPPQSSREQSTVSTAAKSNSGKRPAAVIDLTLSDDEEQAIRGPKRHTGYHAGPNFSTHSSVNRDVTPSNSSSNFAYNIPTRGGSAGGAMNFSA